MSSSRKPRSPAHENDRSFAAVMAGAYQEMRVLASRVLRRRGRKSGPHTTSLVHEAYLRLAGRESPVLIRDERHLLALVARTMRFVLVDHARRATAAKRGDAPAVSELRSDPIEPRAIAPAIAQPSIAPAIEPIDLLELDDAMRRLHAVDPRKAQVVEMRFFGGLSLEEIAAALDVSLATVKRDFLLARAWLFREIEGRAAPKGTAPDG